MIEAIFYVDGSQCTGYLIDMLTCTGHNKLSGQAENAVVHVKLNDDGASSFIGRYHHLQHSRNDSVSL